MTPGNNRVSLSGVSRRSSPVIINRVGKGGPGYPTELSIRRGDRSCCPLHKSGKGAGIQNIRTGCPTPPAGNQPVSQMPEFRTSCASVPRADAHPFPDCFPDKHIIQIETVGRGVAFKCRAGIAGTIDYAFHIDLIWLTSAENSTCRMTDDIHMFMVNRREDAPGNDILRL